MTKGKSGSGIVAIGSVACFVGVILLVIGSGTETGWLSGTGAVLLGGGFFTAVAGRLAS